MAVRLTCGLVTATQAVLKPVLKERNLLRELCRRRAERVLLVLKPLFAEDLRHWGCSFGAAQSRQSVGVLDGAEQAVVVQSLGIDAGAHSRAQDDRRYRLRCPTLVLVKGDDEPAIVPGCPARTG